MPDSVIIETYDPKWPERFRKLGTSLRESLGTFAPRIDHIGSTAVPGMAAKPIIDVQVSVLALEPLDAYEGPLRRAGFHHRPDNPDLTKRYFRETPQRPRTHVHVRLAGSWAEQFSLLFRDYCRAHPDESARYQQFKIELAERYREDRRSYTEAKNPYIWEMMVRADRWSQAVGWKPGPTDA